MLHHSALEKCYSSVQLPWSVTILFQQGKVFPAKVLQFSSALAKIVSLICWGSFPCGNVAVLLCSSESCYNSTHLGESGYISAQFHSGEGTALFVKATNLTGDLLEGRNSNQWLPGWKKGSPKLNKYRAYIGFFLGIELSCRKFHNVDWYDLKSWAWDKHRDWLDFVFRDWLDAMLWDWLVFTLSDLLDFNYWVS